jgi:chorismate dehydratase
MPYRLAAVSFLNTIPLIEWFAATGDPRVILERALPSRLPAILLSGGADAALLPTVEILRSGCGLLGATGIAGRGAVDSVKLFYRGDPRDVGDPCELRPLTRILVDRGSRTSVALLRILLTETAGVTPEFVEIEPRPGRALEPGEGVLVIGDRCFEYDRWRREDPAGAGVAALDLGQAWLELTGLPFVFAAWAAAPGFPETAGSAAVVELAELLTAAREYGLVHLDELVAREAAAGRLGCGGEATTAALDYYFRHSLRYRLESAELAGMRRFHELCVAHHLAPASPGPVVL